jgi:hypothetical protein
MSSSIPDEKEGGFPIYLDPLKRKIVDAAGDEDQAGEWLPMNNPAKRLCKCIEGLRDIQEAIEELTAVQAPKKRRRRLRGIFVPLHALCLGIVDLINAIQSEKSVHSLLPKNCTPDLTELSTKFKTMVPFGNKEKLGMLRHKVSAHYDKDLTPEEMRELQKSVTSSDVAEWINICLAMLCDLLKLNAYTWSTMPPEQNTAVVLCEQPIPVMSVIEVDGPKTEKDDALRITGIRGIYLTTSPRMVVFETIKEVAQAADPLFEEGAKYNFRIQSFDEDQPGVKWSAILRSDKKDSTATATQ